MIRKLIVTTSFLIGCMILCANIVVDKIEPPFWWIGMENKELQIMLYGDQIADCKIALSDPDLILKEVVVMENKNYLFLYIEIPKQVKKSIFEIELKKGNVKKRIKYELRNRTETKGAKGFDASDVLYLIMPDRFADGNTKTNVIPTMRFPVAVNRNNPNARHGGDLQGIENHLDYLEDLGVTAIWLNPVLENDMPGGSYHGYATTDYYKIDPRFGSNQYYKELIAKCHARGMKVVMDMIFNHCGNEHIWFRDKPCENWFNFQNQYMQTSFRLTPHFDIYATEYDKNIMVKGWFAESMPDLNQNNRHLMKYLSQNSIWWIEFAEIDAIRMDTHPYVFFDPISRWCAEIMQAYPQFNIVGECWLSTEAGVAWWQQYSIENRTRNSHLKSVMDFPLQGVVRDAFETETTAWGGLNLLYDKLAMDFLYNNPMDLLTFLDNHDTDRFLLTPPTSLAAYKQAIAFLLTTRGVPQIYYGTEILMCGKKSPDDGLVRLDFPGGFVGDKRNEFMAKGRTAQQNEAYNFVKKLLHWRKNNNTIAKGELLHFMPNNGVYLYSRTWNKSHVVVIMNGEKKEKTISLAQYKEAFGDTQTALNILNGEIVILQNELKLTPKDLIILEF